MESDRHTYLVSYDISDPRRLRKVYQVMCGYGDHVQLSVFRCELTPRELVDLRVALQREISQREDQVLFADLGPSEGRAATAIETLGRPCPIVERHAIVV